jgi:hypothetical protein
MGPKNNVSSAWPGKLDKTITLSTTYGFTREPAPTQSSHFKLGTKVYNVITRSKHESSKSGSQRINHSWLNPTPVVKVTTLKMMSTTSITKTFAEFTISHKS